MFVLVLLAIGATPQPQFAERVPVPAFIQRAPVPTWPNSPKIPDSSKPPQPADNGRWVSVCEGGVCRLQWVPYSTAPIQQPVVTPQYEYRRGLFGRTYRVQVR